PDSDSASSVTGLVLQSAYGTGKLVLQGALPTRGRADAHIQLEGFPLVGVYALLERDTAGVGGTLTVTAGLSGTRASPVSSGSFSVSNGAFGEFRAPFVDGTYDYHDRRLGGAIHLWRSGQQILGVQAYLPLDLALEPVPRRQLPDTLSVDARADSVGLSVLEALTPALQRVTGVFSADLGIAGTWDAPRLRGELQLAEAATAPRGATCTRATVQQRILHPAELAATSLAALVQQQRVGPEFQNVSLDSLRIEDLDLEMGSDVWLRSNEANLQPAGSTRLTK